MFHPFHLNHRLPFVTKRPRAFLRFLSSRCHREKEIAQHSVAGNI